MAMKYPNDPKHITTKEMGVKAGEVFKSLLVTFAKYKKNGWRVGNAFDALTDYLLRFPDAESSPGAVVELAMSRWKSPDIQDSMCWYDDFGWWGIASAKAFLDEFACIFGSHRSEFQELATECWDFMHSGKPNKAYSYRGGPNVWENRDEGSAPGYFTNPDTWAQPRFDQGVWQYEMFRELRPKAKECSYTNPSDPKTCSPKLGAFQLTVMNGLYFVLALRLRAWGKEAEKAFGAEREFLQHWFFNPTLPDQQLLWHLADGTGVLVRERVSTYAELDKAFPPVQGYKRDAAWCGDQGLILGGMLDYLQVHPSDPDAQSLPGKIMTGVFSGMVADNKVVQPMTPVMEGIDDEDYDCGSGVFWRYLLGGFRQNAALRTEVLKLVAADPENNAIYKSAEDAFNGNSLGDELFKDFNALATLTAATEILKEAGE
jgi:hypothetical protein